MKLSNWKSIALLSALTLSLAACNTDDAKEEKPVEQVTAQEHKEEAGHKEETEHHDEHEGASNLRLVVSTDDGRYIIHLT